jgi:membrane-bound serine protease (ClpP class)
MRSLRRAALLLFFVTALAAACSESAPDGAVHVLRSDGDVGPIMERYFDRGISRAEDSHARLVVIELDTPGGLDTSMRDIVQRIERAKVPVAVYVSPSGGRAASAGTFITMAANIAAMAPNTSIGAASAINSDGSDIGGTLGKKIENDAVAFIRGIAELRGRNADWAESAVRDAVAVNQSQAVELHVVDFVANDLDDLLRQAEGRTVSLQPGSTVQLEGLVGAPVVHTDMTAWEHFLDFIADPTLASLLITIGFFGIIFELANPGLIFPGVAGAIALVLGFIGFGVLPVDTAGLVLIALGLLLFAIELFVQSGFLAAGGIVSLVLGAIIAFRDTPSELRPSRFLLAVIGFVIAGMVISLALAIARVRRTSSAMGTSALIGKIAVARTALAPEGFVFIQGERWQAELERGRAQEGDRVRIVGAQGLRLRVRKEEET